MSNTIIRQLGPQDFQDLRVLYVQLTNGSPVADGEGGLRLWQQILSHPGTYVFGAEVLGRIVSVASVHIVPNLTFEGRPHARIENVVTDDSFRGQGIGAKVIRACLAEIERHDCISVILLTTKDTGARGFYEKLGFDADLKHGMIKRYPRP